MQSEMLLLCSRLGASFSDTESDNSFGGDFSDS